MISQNIHSIQRKKFKIQKYFHQPDDPIVLVGHFKVLYGSLEESPQGDHHVLLDETQPALYVAPSFESLTQGHPLPICTEHGNYVITVLHLRGRLGSVST